MLSRPATNDTAAARGVVAVHVGCRSVLPAGPGAATAAKPAAEPLRSPLPARFRRAGAHALSSSTHGTGDPSGRALRSPASTRRCRRRPARPIAVAPDGLRPRASPLARRACSPIEARQTEGNRNPRPAPLLRFAGCSTPTLTPTSAWTRSPSPRCGPASTRPAVTRAFNTLSTERMTFDRCEITITGDRAIAQCAGTHRIHPQRRRTPPAVAEDRLDFRLSRSSGQWRISGVNSR